MRNWSFDLNEREIWLQNRFAFKKLEDDYQKWEKNGRMARVLEIAMCVYVWQDLSYRTLLNIPVVELSTSERK